jgi:hypothetical protein
MHTLYVMNNTKRANLLEMFYAGVSHFDMPAQDPTSITLVINKRRKIVARYFIVYQPMRVCSFEYPYMFYTLLYTRNAYTLFRVYDIVNEVYEDVWNEYRLAYYGSGYIHKPYVYHAKYGYVLDRLFHAE